MNPLSSMVCSSAWQVVGARSLHGRRAIADARGRVHSAAEQRAARAGGGETECGASCVVRGGVERGAWHASVRVLYDAKRVKQPRASTARASVAAEARLATPAGQLCFRERAVRRAGEERRRARDGDVEGVLRGGALPRKPSIPSDAPHTIRIMSRNCAAQRVIPGRGLNRYH
jgi:hypothetical protein